MRVVLFGSEEIAQPNAPFGEFGGHSYADNHLAELPNHVLAGESDLGTDRIYSLALPPAVAKGDFADSVRRVLTPLGVLFSRRAETDFGADVEPSIKAGVPGVGTGRRTRAGYFDIHHTSDDTLDKVDRAQLDQNVAAPGGARVACGRQRPRFPQPRRRQPEPSDE